MTMKTVDAKRLQGFLPKSWKEDRIFVISSEDTVLVKRIIQPKYMDIRERLLKAGKRITKKDLMEAIRAARS